MRLKEYLFLTEFKDRDVLKIDLKKYPELFTKNGNLNYKDKTIEYFILDKATIMLDGWRLCEIIGDININFIHNFIEDIIEENVKKLKEVCFTNYYGKNIKMLDKEKDEYFNIECDDLARVRTDLMLLKNIDGIDLYDELVCEMPHFPQLNEGHFYLVTRDVKKYFENRIDVVVPILEKDIDKNTIKCKGITY